MKRVIILNSPLYEEINPKNKEDYLPPIGLGIIFSAIEKKFNVSFIDSIAENLSVDLVIALLEKEKPDFVCINIFTTNYSLVKLIDS
jgi:anaerobic magnesium-protoporphyrin IX monomethyl ester cyclase